MIAVFFKTYGCQANVADSEGLSAYLQGLGCMRAEDERAADLVIINTCAVREKAEQKMFSYLGELAGLRQFRPYMRIGVIGCVASYKKQEIYARFDHINFVYGAKEDMAVFQAYLADIIVALETAKQMYEMGMPLTIAVGQDRDIKQIVAEKKLTTSERPVIDGGATAMVQKEGAPEVARSYINIMTGCNNYCTYCIVPFTRGREKSYELSSIIERVAKDVANGAKEVTLIGQNVNSYKDPVSGAGFAELLAAVAQVPGEFWVRYVSPHPKDMTNDVLETMAQYSDKLCAWVHLPLQSGSDAILHAMNRTYTVAEYLEQVKQIHQILPAATITTDIIVGFPGETEDDYLGTRAIMEAVRFDHIFSFIYSVRKYTKAYALGDPISPEVKADRLERLQKRQQEICWEQNKKMEGREFRALVEKVHENGGLLARTAGNVRVLVDGSAALIGSFVTIKVERAGVAQVSGVLVSVGSAMAARVPKNSVVSQL